MTDHVLHAVKTAAYERNDLCLRTAPRHDQPGTGREGVHRPPPGGVHLHTRRHGQLDGLSPEEYLKTILTRMANGHPINRIDEVLPWRTFRAVLRHNPLEHKVREVAVYLLHGTTT